MKQISLRQAFSFSVIVFLFVAVFSTQAISQKMDRIDRERAESMLTNVRKTLKSEYYDATFGGRDIDADFAAAEEKLKAAESLGQAFAIIAQAVVNLNDSHTRFFPPARNIIVDYGWRMRMFGDKCFVTLVNPKSDAAKKGLEVGDQILAFNKFAPSRSEMWKMVYFYQQLSPRNRASLSVLKPDGKKVDLDVETSVIHLKSVVDLTSDIDINAAAREGARLNGVNKHYFNKVGGVALWKMPSFAFDPDEVDRFTSELKGSQALILDLRGNPGGLVVTLEKVAGFFFDKDTKIADLQGRKKMDPQLAESAGAGAFKGKVVVLVDSASASAAEIFSRLMQLEKRGVVLGDVSAGAVMQSRGFGLDVGSGNSIPYSVSVTNANVIMSDGKSLEHVGVTPDELIIPTGADLAARRDPVLARALQLLGQNVTPADAGKLFPAEEYFERHANIAFNFVDF